MSMPEARALAERLDAFSETSKDAALNSETACCLEASAIALGSFLTADFISKSEFSISDPCRDFNSVFLILSCSSPV